MDQVLRFQTNYNALNFEMGLCVSLFATVDNMLEQGPAQLCNKSQVFRFRNVAKAALQGTQKNIVSTLLIFEQNFFEKNKIKV